MRLEAESESEEEEGDGHSDFLLQLDPDVRQMINSSRRAALGTREEGGGAHTNKVGVAREEGGGALTSKVGVAREDQGRRGAGSIPARWVGPPFVPF